MMVESNSWISVYLYSDSDQLRHASTQTKSRYSMNSLREVRWFQEVQGALETPSHYENSCEDVGTFRKFILG